MTNITIFSNDPLHPELTISATSVRGTNEVIPVRINEVGTDFIKISWGLHSDRNITKIYIDSEPPVNEQTGELANPYLIATVTNTSISSYTISDISPSSYVFIRVEVETTSSEIISGNSYAITRGGQGETLDSSVRFVQMVAPNIMAVTLTNLDVTSWSPFSDTYDNGNTTLVPNNGPIYSDSTNWTITDFSGNPISILNIGLETNPIKSPYWSLYNENTGYNDDHRLDIDHTVFIKINQPIGNKNIYTINGPLGVSFKFVFSDKYSVSESIQVNQVGYAPRSNLRYAYVSNWLGTLGAMDLSGFPSTVNVTKEITETKRQNVLTSIPLTVRSSMDSFAGTPVKEINLATLPHEEGRFYRIQVPGVGVSWKTQVSENAVFKTYYTIMRAFTHNRWAQDLNESWTDWSHKPADHTSNIWLGDGSDGTSGVPDMFAQDTPRTVELDPIYGGHHDAGDFDIRHSHTCVAYRLLQAYEIYGTTKFVDEQLNIPESGDGIPDLLSEALYQVKMWEALQNPSTGAVKKGIESFRHPVNDFSHKDPSPYWTFSEDPRTTGHCAGIFAQAAYLLKDLDSTRSEELKDKAVLAYTYAINNGINAETGAGIIAHAATELFRLTGEPEYYNLCEALWAKWNVNNNGWFSASSARTTSIGDYNLDASSYQVRTINLIPYYDATGINSTFVPKATTNINNLASQNETKILNTNAHRFGLPVGYPTGYGSATYAAIWLKEMFLRKQYFSTRTGQALNLMTPTIEQSDYNIMSLTYDWILGCNPLGMCWVTGLGSKRPREVLWWDSLCFDKTTDLGPIPGCIPYGLTNFIPNLGYYMYSKNATYPLVTNRPKARIYIDIRSSVICSEFDIVAWTWNVPLFASMIKDGGIVPNQEWRPGGSESRNPYPPDVNSDGLLNI